jgi:hypothetical protein
MITGALRGVLILALAVILGALGGFVFGGAIILATSHPAHLSPTQQMGRVTEHQLELWQKEG